jgi:hypothetical protein
LFRDDTGDPGRIFFSIKHIDDMANAIPKRAIKYGQRGV